MGYIWGVGKQSDGAIEAIDADIDPCIPQELLMDELLYSLVSFPNTTGLRWDKVHPKAMRRANAQRVKALLKFLIRCEAVGEWPVVIELVILCVLPKPEGGFRPIGLLPILPRMWMRSRRNATLKWERRNDRSCLHAGEGTAHPRRHGPPCAAAQAAHTCVRGEVWLGPGTRVRVGAAPSAPHIERRPRRARMPVAHGAEHTGALGSHRGCD